MSIDTAILIAKWLMVGQLVLVCVLTPIWLYSTWKYQKTQAELDKSQWIPVYKDPEP